MHRLLGTDCAVGVSPNCFQSYTEDVHVQRVQVSQTEERFTHRQVAEGTVTVSDNRYGSCKYVSARPNLSSTAPPDLKTAWSMIMWLMDRVSAVESTVNIALSTAVAANEACENLAKLADEKEDNVKVQEGDALLGGRASGVLLERETTPPIARVSTTYSESGLSEADTELLALKSRLMEIRKSLSAQSSPVRRPSTGCIDKDNLSPDDAGEDPDTPGPVHVRPTSLRRPSTGCIDKDNLIPADAEEDPDTPGIGSHRRVPFDITPPLPCASIEDGLTPCPFRTLYGERSSTWAHCLQQNVGDVDFPCDPCDPCDDNDIATEELSPKPHHSFACRAATAASAVCTEHSRRCCSTDERSDDSVVLP